MADAPKTVLIDILVYDGNDELDVIGPFETLKSAEGLGVPFKTRLVGAVSAAPIACHFGIVLTPEKVIVPGEADIVVVPGGGWGARSPVGTWGEYSKGVIPDLLRRMAALDESARPIFTSVCTGAMLLAQADIIHAKSRATTHHTAWTDLVERSGATLVKERFVDDGNLITAGGVTSGIDLALYLVERFHSKEVSQKLAERLEYPNVPKV
ncbi:class I glutamine amidotransferase-like protein [Entophlyctis helioformis]|nr:class I glutamine amidotransferase-like protein [Entophlyctis helioformis]